MIKDFNTHSTIDNITNDLSGIFKYIKINNNTLLASSIVDKLGRPIVRIDSRKPITALMLKFGKKSITIKSIVNSTGERGFSKKIIDVILKNIEKDWSIEIDQDVSGGFWDKIIERYPDYNWIKI
jgi:hypothetical protein